MNYLVAVKTGKTSQLFSFETRKDRTGFIDEIKEKYKDVQYATSEVMIR